MSSNPLSSLPTTAPLKPKGKLRFADVAVTATAREFAGIYRNKQYHEPDFSAVLERALAAGVEKVMLTGMSLSDVATNLDIAKQRPSQCFVTIGVHPYHASEPESEADYFDRLLEAVQDALQMEPCPLAAFGELGLDYDRVDRCPKDVQIRIFKTQLDLLVENKLDLPLFLHCRAAFDDFAPVLQQYLPHLPRRGLVHSFVGTAAQMSALVDMGFDISVNGFSFREEESLDMVRSIPLQNLQIETDAPWGEIPAKSEVAKRYLAHAAPLPPSKKRDKFTMGLMVKERNESCSIDRVAFVTAGLKGLTVDEVAEAAWRNSIRMFGLGEREIEKPLVKQV
ncbi:TatD family hydrolase [Pleurostoma richardsiae]|uniref:TatD family hydrolase n=1 Tax=Pleurostoma richardsiae TaxID=41990 RepID=A0AA38RV47_9PEZI|nr:TatD family hydrolase [Pleurostoma richardsiae]